MRMSAIFAALCGVALAGLIGALGTGLTAGGLDESSLVAHRGMALAGAILVVFAHSVVFVYMIGTGRAIKDAVRDFDVDQALYDEHCDYKWRAAPWALTCTALVVATAVLGGVTDSGGVAVWIHPILAVATLIANLYGLPAEYRTIRDNGVLLDRVAEVTAEKNRDKIAAGVDPAPPASPLTGGGWSLVMAASAWLPWLYIRYVMGRSDTPWWPFLAASLIFVVAFVRGLRKPAANA